MNPVNCGTIAVLLISALEYTVSKSPPGDGTGLRTTRSIVNLGRRCKPETRFTEGCNLCICTIYGYALCTAMECHEPIIYTEPKEECTPGRRWKQDCNTCYCSDDSTVKCTDLQCDGLFRETNFIERNRRDVDLRKSVKKYDGLACEKGEVITEGCQNCFCTRKGWKCMTLMSCLNPEQSARVGEKPDFNIFMRSYSKNSILPI